MLISKDIIVSDCSYSANQQQTIALLCARLGRSVSISLMSDLRTLCEYKHPRLLIK